MQINMYPKEVDASSFFNIDDDVNCPYCEDHAVIKDISDYEITIQCASCGKLICDSDELNHQATRLRNEQIDYDADMNGITRRT